MTGIARLVRLLPQTGGADIICRSFRDQSLVDLILLALDFVYDEDGEDELLNDLYEVMGKAEDKKKKKLPAIRAWLESILTPHADEIEAAEKAASSH